MFRMPTGALVRFEQQASVHKRSFNTQKSFSTPSKPSTGYALLLCPLTAFGLGCWQIKRRSWKLALIEDLKKKTEASPVDLPEDLRNLEELEYRKVRVRGTFDHDEEVYVGPRSDRNSTKTGFFVVTPLKLENRDYSILVNRGWVARHQTNPATRREGQLSGLVEIEGVVRRSEPKLIASNQVRSGAFFAMRDVNMLAQSLGTAPVFIDAVEGSSVPGGPVAGQTRVELRNEHASYIATWFSLSAVTLIMWYKRYGKRLR